jgi:hypothetical protein
MENPEAIVLRSVRKATTKVEIIPHQKQMNAASVNQ